MWTNTSQPKVDEESFISSLRFRMGEETSKARRDLMKTMDKGKDEVSRR